MHAKIKRSILDNPLKTVLSSAVRYKKLIRIWDSKREIFYEDIVHVLQSTID